MRYQRMKVMTMLELSAMPLDDLATALEDNSYESSWWLDPATGRVEYCSVDDDVEEFEERDLLHIQPIGSSEAYADMAEFVEGVRAARPRDRLRSAIEGRGAFRRFKDTLFDFPDLQDEWFAFKGRMMRKHAITWLLSLDLIDTGEADDALAAVERGSQTPQSGATPARAAAALRALYEDRLVEVVVFGSHATGKQDADSDLDLMVVLRDPVSPWDELRRMDDLLWELSQQHGVTISALPLGEALWRTGKVPVLVEARAHGYVAG